MDKSEYQKNKEEHLKFLKMDNYQVEYCKDFVLEIHYLKLKKIGFWLNALVKKEIKPITEEQKIFLKNIEDVDGAKKRISEYKSASKDYNASLYLKDIILKENWKDIFVKIESFSEEQKTSLASVLDCESNSDSILKKIYVCCFKPIAVINCIEDTSIMHSYFEILKKVSSKLQIPIEDKDTVLELGEKITQKTFSDIVDGLSEEQRKELEAKLLEEAQSLGIDVGSASIFTVLAAGGLAGFAPYLLVTSTVGLLSGIIGITLPFGLYTMLTTGVSYLLGPVGWIGASIFAISRYKKMNMKKLVPAIIFIHSFSLEKKMKKQLN